jgi:hypothetical protein
MTTQKGALLTWCVRCTTAANRTITHYQLTAKAGPTWTGLGRFVPSLACSHLIGLGADRSPHTGHSIMLKVDASHPCRRNHVPAFRANGIERRPHRMLQEAGLHLPPSPLSLPPKQSASIPFRRRTLGWIPKWAYFLTVIFGLLIALLQSYPWLSIEETGFLDPNNL